MKSWNTDYLARVTNNFFFMLFDRYYGWFSGLPDWVSFKRLCSCLELVLQNIIFIKLYKFPQNVRAGGVYDVHNHFYCKIYCKDPERERGIIHSIMSIHQMCGWITRFPQCKSWEKEEASPFSWGSAGNFAETSQHWLMSSPLQSMVRVKPLKARC